MVLRAGFDPQLGSLTSKEKLLEQDHELPKTDCGWIGSGYKYAINRKYLKLKVRLTPYFYTLSCLAYDTGAPPVRATAMEFPTDVSTYRNHVGSSQQFMSGPSFLVAPVYTSDTRRDGIYLPDGDWVDYWDWNDGTDDGE